MARRMRISMDEIESVFITLNTESHSFGENVIHEFERLGFTDLIERLFDGFTPSKLLIMLSGKVGSEGVLFRWLSTARERGYPGLEKEGANLIAGFREVKGLMSDYEIWIRSLRIKTVFFAVVSSIFSAMMSIITPMLVKLLNMLGKEHFLTSALHLTLIYLAINVISMATAASTHGKTKFVLVTILLCTFTFTITYMLAKIIFNI